MERMTMARLDEMKKEGGKAPKDWIKVGLSTCGIAAGADKVYQILSDEVQLHNLDIKVLRCGCAGRCYAEPLVEVSVTGMPQVVYGKVTEPKAVEIIRKHVLNKTLLDDHIFEVRGK
jgi:NADP-reducing hydrogenase subunit HndB